jgi:hypothetical protein
MSIEVEQNFDWSETKRKLIIFALNYHRDRFVEISLRKFSTSTSLQDWLYVVGNDNCRLDFDLHQFGSNVRYLNLLRNSSEERNGSFLRNYFIKRCQSDLLLQKDGEVVLLDDPVKACLEKKIWRPGWIYVLNPKLSELYYQGQLLDPAGSNQDLNMHGFPNQITDSGDYSADQAKKSIMAAAGGSCMSTYYHYAYCVPTKVLQDLRGYDERYTHYGFEDSDMFCRLAYSGVRLHPDYNCRAVHLWHDKQIVSNKLNDMGNLFQTQRPEDTIRNLGVWGEGE